MNTIIQTPTNNLDLSLDFYSKLEFEIISHETLTLVTDGKVIIEINPDRYARGGIKLFDVTWEQTVNELEKSVAIIKTDSGYILSDPSGTWIYLEETQNNNEFDLSSTSTSVLGNFAGLSLETIAIEQAMQLWQSLGFSKNSGSIEDGWISLSNNDGVTVSIMKPLVCPHLFFNPSLSYFNGENNPAIIEKIRKLNIPITEEITYFNKAGIVDNIILRDPGGFGFFVFND